MDFTRGFVASVLGCLLSIQALAASPVAVSGFVAPGFEEVAREFEKNFRDRHEIGAAVAAYHKGRKVVDLWGGYRDLKRKEPWREDTMVVVFSTTKGLAAMAFALAHSRGWLDYEEKVATYWPEFAQNGKEKITVRQLLAHEAGLVLLDENPPVTRIPDHEFMSKLLARQKPLWEVGKTHGYHASTIGMYMSELFLRIDPRHRSLGQFFQEEIARPLGAEFYIGLPAEIPDSRLAELDMITPLKGILGLKNIPGPMRAKVLWPASYFTRSLKIPAKYNARERASLAVELPAGNGVGTARALARVYGAFATGAGELGLKPETMALLTADPVVPPEGPADQVIGIDSYFSLGFLKPTPGLDFGSSRRAFGSSGAGGSSAFADPDRELSYAYVMNRMDVYLSDPRDRALRAALERCLQALGSQ